MDQGLKERLIGAAVLVALGVWLIPWVLDGKKEQVELDGAEAALRLPTPEEPLPFRSQTLSLEEPDPVTDEPAASEFAASEPSTADAPANATAAQDAQPSQTHDRDEREPSTVAPEEPVVARAAPAPSAERSVAPPSVAPPSAAPPSPAPQAAPVARTDAKGAWVVQLGSFGEAENAKRLAQRVNTYGYKPEVSDHRVNGRAMYRVRVGPYATRAQADATASALSAHGVPGQVVAAD
jgi:DedD protein